MYRISKRKRKVSEWAKAQNFRIAHESSNWMLAPFLPRPSVSLCWLLLSINSIANYLIISLVCFHFKLANSVDFPPIITPSEPEVTVLPSENANFTCQSTEPVHWRFFVSAVDFSCCSILPLICNSFDVVFSTLPNHSLNCTIIISFIHKQEGFESIYNIHESYNQNNEYPYQSILELPNVNYLSVGYYYCVKNATVDEHLDTLVDSGQASNIYLFVEGKFCANFSKANKHFCSIANFDSSNALRCRSPKSDCEGGQSNFERCTVSGYHYTMQANIENVGHSTHQRRRRGKVQSAKGIHLVCLYSIIHMFRMK